MDDRPLPLLVVVSGVPGSGKTTLATSLAEALHVPLLVRDAIKEGMHVTVGAEDPAERRRFAVAAFRVFYDVIAAYLDAGVSLVAEAALHREPATAELGALVARSRAVVVHCHVDPAIAAGRYRDRAHAGGRHPAHDDVRVASAMAQGAFPWATYDPPDVAAARVDVNTADGYRPSLPEILARIRAHATGPSGGDHRSAIIRP